MIEFRGLTKVYSKREGPAIREISLTVKDGEILGLVGLNGAGKTTMMRIASGLALPTEGTVVIGGHDIVSEKVEASSTLGMVPEFPNFEPTAKAVRLLEYLAGYNGLDGDGLREEALSLLREVGLGGAEWRKVGAFSQGMKKRFSLAAALISRPHNLLLDEILNGLDPEGIRFIRNLLLRLKANGLSILLSSHILSEVEHVADRIAIIHHGRLRKVITMEDVISSTEQTLRVVLQNDSKDALDYLASIGQISANGRVITISKPSEKPWVVNSELLRRGAEVSELAMEREDLESYFFREIGGQP